MPRQHHPRTKSSKSTQRLKVVPEAAVLMVDHSGPTAQNGIRGQHGVVEEKAQRVGRVPRRRQNRDPQPGGVDDLAVGQRPTTSAQVTAADRADHRPGGVDQSVDAVRVVPVPVADQHQRDAAQRGHPFDVRGVVGSGIHHDDLVAAPATQHPGVGALERHGPGVVAQQDRCGLGDRPQKSVRGMGQVAARHRGVAIRPRQ